MWARRHFASLPRVFLDVCVEAIEPLNKNPNEQGYISGRLVIELRSDVVPKTAENFRKLCLGGNGKTASGHEMTYKNSKFHRIIPGFMIQGGDYTKGNGTGGQSIYESKFNDENFILKHSSAGVVSMANAGPNTNGSQFFITLAATSWLDGKHVVFGKLVEGMELLKEIERTGSSSGTPKAKVVVTDCGQIELSSSEEEESSPKS
mmetsp:Transcript_15830/g.28973  ORF Transcript_15830/g.28973 Transcript_15830/m.28973 type:complete len:205 (-) Transcript_15830:2089-2703(-)